MQHVDPEKGQERVEPVKDHGPAQQGDSEAGECRPSVPAFGCLRQGSDMRLCVVTFGETWQHVEQERRHDDRWDHEAGGTLEAKPEESGGGDKGTNGKTELAADSEEAHCRGLLLSGQMVHQPGALRMEHGDTQSAHHNGGDAHGIRWSVPGKGDAESHEEHGKRKQPRRRSAVGDVAEDRLQDGRYEINGKTMVAAAA